MEKEELDLRFSEGIQLGKDQLALVQQTLKSYLGEEVRSDWGPQEDDAGIFGWVCELCRVWEESEPVPHLRPD